jgi:hypothetical protein
MVRVSAPDLERFPRFSQALAAAETVDVDPGDAVFIPNLWWHNVESLERGSLSVNDRWRSGPLSTAVSARDVGCAVPDLVSERIRCSAHESR